MSRGRRTYGGGQGKRGRCQDKRGQGNRTPATALCAAPPPSSAAREFLRGRPIRMQGMCFAPLLPARRPNATYKRIVVWGGGADHPTGAGPYPRHLLPSHGQPPSIAPPEEGQSSRMPPAPLQPVPSRSRRRARLRRGPAGAAPCSRRPLPWPQEDRGDGASARQAVRRIPCPRRRNACERDARRETRRVPSCAAPGRPPAGGGIGCAGRGLKVRRPAPAGPA